MVRISIASVLILAGAVAAPAQAYEKTQAEYERMLVLPNWDNEGNLPEGDSRRAELAWIRADLEARADVLRVRGRMIAATERQTHDRKRTASLRADYRTQIESFKRWTESMNRRREAILKSASAPAKPVEPEAKTAKR